MFFWTCSGAHAGRQRTEESTEAVAESTEAVAPDFLWLIEAVGPETNYGPLRHGGLIFVIVHRGSGPGKIMVL